MRGWAMVAALLAGRGALAEPLAEGVRFLATHQGTFASGPGRLVQDGWEWRPGSGLGAANTSGVVGLAMLEASERLHDPAARASAQERARAVRAVLAGGGEAYAPDLELLARVARDADDAPALASVREAVAARVARAGGPDAEVRRLVSLRGSSGLAGYDTAQLAEAAAACGLDDLGRALVRAASSDPAATDRRSTGAVVSTGALTAAAARLGLGKWAQAGAAHLLGLQGRDGSWHLRETEATAYAVRALALVAAGTGSTAALAAAARGRDWLARTQLRSGAWADYHDGLPEPFVGEVFSSASAEALRALAAAP